MVILAYEIRYKERLVLEMAQKMFIYTLSEKLIKRFWNTKHKYVKISANIWNYYLDELRFVNF